MFNLRNGFFVLVVLTVIASATGFVLYESSSEKSRQFTSSATARILPSRAELTFARDVLGGSSTAQTRSFMRTVKEIMRSDDVLARALEALPSHNPGVDLDAEVAALRAAVDIVDIDGSLILQVSVSDEDPERAAALANGLVEAYNAESAEEDAEAIAKLRQELQFRLKDLEEQFLLALNAELATRSEIGALAVESEIRRLERALDDQTGKLAAAQIRRASLETIVGASDKTVSQASTSVTGLLGTPVITPSGELALLEGEIDERERTIAQLEKNLATAASKEILLRSSQLRQEELRRTTSQVLQTLHSAEQLNGRGDAYAVLLVSARPANKPDVPGPLQFSVVGGSATFLVLSALLAIIALITRLSSSEAPQQRASVEWESQRDRRRDGPGEHFQG